MENTINNNSGTAVPTGGIIDLIAGGVSNIIGSLSILGVGSRSRIKEIASQNTFLLEQQEQRAHKNKITLVLMIMALVVIMAILSVK